MWDEMRSIKSGRKELREFGFVMGGVGGLLFGWLLFKEHPAAPYWGGTALAFVACALGAPLVLLPLQKIWMGLAICMGAVMSRLILTVLYYVVITPLGFVMRLTGHHFLGDKQRRESYWKLRHNGNATPEADEKQY